MISIDPIWQLTLLLSAHWLGDFVCQTTWMATRKHQRLDALTVHVVVYSIVIAGAAILMFGPAERAAYFVMCNAGLHFVTDFFTSKATAALQVKGNLRGFFVVLGLDQLLHHVALAATLVWFTSA